MALNGYKEEANDVVLAAIRGVHKIFTHLIVGGAMYMEAPPLPSADLSELNIEDKYKAWLRDQYGEARTNLIQLLHHENANIKELSLCTLMKFISSELQNPITKHDTNKPYFPFSFFEEVCRGLLSTTDIQVSLIERFQEYLEYDDIRYYSMKCISKALKLQNKNDTFLQNTFTMLDNLSMGSATPEDGKLNKLMGKVPESGTNFKVNTHKEHLKSFTALWMDFLRNKMCTSLYKKVLMILHEKVIPYMTSPLQLSDFLTESYNIGGVISLLALNGIFILVNTYNLDYPDFYNKLYSLFEPGVFHVKYKARFFYLADLFLTSTHLPAYLVAAFTKRLSRLSLTAPPSGLVIIIPFIYNLMRRHPACKILMHNPDNAQDLESDPFIADEKDPSKCKALESSLWEIKTLQSHYHHSIATQTKKIDQPLSREENEIAPLLETTIDDMFDKEKRKKFKDMPMTFEKPKGLFDCKEDQFKELWILE